MTNDSSVLRAVAERALEFLPDEGVIGLGTGHAAATFLEALAGEVRRGRKIRGVPTSQASADMAARLGIPQVTLDECPQLDVDFDGADEVDPAGNLIKGYGGAMVREKIVAQASLRRVILVGPEKIVDRLGSRGKLPVEIVPFGYSLCHREITALGLVPQLRRDGGQPHLTDNGNFILDCGCTALNDPASLEAALVSIPGVVGTGLFLDMQPIVLVGHADRVEVRNPH